MTQEPGYPYDTVPQAFMPSTVGSDSSFVISAQEHGNGKNTKKWLAIVLLLFLLLSFVVTILIIQRRQSLADIRNYAVNEEDQNGPQQGFGGLASTPAQIAQDLPPVCLPGDTSPRCQTTRTTITAMRITPTSTPRPPSRATPTPPSPFAFLRIFTPFLPTSEPTPTVAEPTPTPREPTVTPTQQPDITSTPILTLTPASTVTATPVPMLSCQRVEIYKGTESVTQNVSAIGYGDKILFIGYVSDVGRPVESITFRLMVNDTTVEEKQVPASLSGNAWVAQYEHTFSVYGRHRVTVTAITPKP